MEVWKDIDGFEGCYKISSSGKIFSLYKNIYLSPCINEDGYFVVGLKKDKKHHSRLVHRLVAQNFIPNPENKLTVNHKDFDKLNNNDCNLERNTIKENNHHFQASFSTPDNLKSIKIICTQTGNVYTSIQDAANSLGTARSNLSRKLSGIRPNNTSLIYHIE